MSLPSLNPVASGHVPEHCPVFYRGDAEALCPRCGSGPGESYKLIATFGPGGVLRSGFAQPSLWTQCAGCEALLPVDPQAFVEAVNAGMPEGLGIPGPVEEGPNAGSGRRIRVRAAIAAYLLLVVEVAIIMDAFIVFAGLTSLGVGFYFALRWVDER